MPDMSQWSPADLVQACRRQDAAAWEELVTRYERLVYTVPLRYGLTEAEAEDVFQSVWLALLRALPNLNQPERVAAWLVTTAKRECWERRRGSGYTHEEDMAPDDMASTNWMAEATPEEIVTRYDQQRLLRQTIQRLDDLCRRLLSLLYLDAAEPSYAEVAVQLGLPEGSVGPTRARCLQKARRLMEA
jgi:RNA polymerase sigma factor (sigma-70 family)